MNTETNYKSRFAREFENGDESQDDKTKLYLIAYTYRGIPVGFSVMGRYHGYDVLGFTDLRKIWLLSDEILGYMKSHVLAHELTHIKKAKTEPENVSNEEKVDYMAKQMCANYA